jgi:glucuronate isomerase
MRLAGVPERCITGDADPEEKFNAWPRCCRI